MGITSAQFQKAVAERRRERRHGAREYEAELVACALTHARVPVGGGRSRHVAAEQLGRHADPASKLAD